MDRALGIWLILIFGISGTAVILASWLVPALQPDRATATIAGSLGIVIAAARGFTLRQKKSAPTEAVPVKVKTDDSI